MSTGFLPAEEIRVIAGKAASAVLPDEVAETLPVVTNTEHGVRVLVLYYRILGRPPQGRPTLPTHAMLIDGRSGKVERFWALAPGELGLTPPLAKVAGAAADMSNINTFIDRRNRFLELSPDVWLAFEARSASTDAATRAKVEEYWQLFKQITQPDIAAYYTHAAKDFFDWVRAVAGSP